MPTTAIRRVATGTGAIFGVALIIWGVRAATGPAVELSACSASRYFSSSVDFVAPANTIVQKTFEDIYGQKSWGYEGGGSGVGSSLHATATVRLILELVIQRYGITSLTDAPCGSMHWIPLALTRIARHAPCFTYLGVDVVRPVVAGVCSAAAQLEFPLMLTAFASTD
jgi:hypothetical protein